MKQYWPCGLRRNEDGTLTPVSTYDSFLDLGQARRQIELWRDWYKFDLPQAWIDVYERGVKVQKMDEGLERNEHGKRT